MTDNQKNLWSGIIRSVTKPISFLTLFLLIGESLLFFGISQATGVERTIFIVGILLLLFVVLIIFAYLAIRRPSTLGAATGEESDTTIVDFESLLADICKTIDNLEHDGAGKVEIYLKKGDFPRLLDGLYSSLLYASSALATGKIEAIFYGNMFEWQESSNSLRVRYFKGPYNDEVITRYFPVEGANQGVASAAITTGEIQIRNSMESELKVPGEGLLKSMISIPIVSGKKELENGAIVALNIDCVKGNGFPEPNSEAFKLIQNRANQIVKCVQQVNKLRKKRLLSKFSTLRLANANQAIAPDGSRVLELLHLPKGSMAQFRLDSRAVSHAVVHRSIEEIWYFLSGNGEMWRKQGEQEEVTSVEAGVCITIPVGSCFQFRSLGSEALIAIGATMPPWPGDIDEKSEARKVKGRWEPTV